MKCSVTGAIADGNGIYYMNSRYYNSNTGRFLTQDSYIGNAYEPWTQHLYTYCGNNPVNFIDPTGHRTVSDDPDVSPKLTVVPCPQDDIVAAAAGIIYYRYVDEAEFQAIRQTGRIPNVNARGLSKDVYITNSKYESVSEAENALQIGSKNPNGKYSSPKYRVSFESKTIDKGSFAQVKGGTGMETTTRDSISVDINDIEQLNDDVNGISDNIDLFINGWVGLLNYDVSGSASFFDSYGIETSFDNAPPQYFEGLSFLPSPLYPAPVGSPFAVPVSSSPWWQPFAQPVMGVAIG